MSKHIIEFEGVCFTYGAMQGQRPVQAVCDLSFAIEKGSHVALIGRNGSGKSTIARLMNGLLLPDQGRVTVGGLVTEDASTIYEVRRQCGMVFQNPDNQIIGTTVKDDVAFGPSNLGLPKEEILSRVDRALELTGLLDLKDRAPHQLSGGQKQKLAIASVLAMRPDCIILDEATSMLDPVARKDIMALIVSLQQRFGLTIVQITHHMEEALLADQIHVISQGSIALSGRPAQIFDQANRVREEGLALPTYVEIAQMISRETGQAYDSEEIIDFEGAVASVKRALSHVPGHLSLPIDGSPVPSREREAEPLIQVRHLNYTYPSEGLVPVQALLDIQLEIAASQVIGIAGHTGSGKSTLIQHFNGLIPSKAGTVIVMGKDLSERKVIRDVRRQVGLLFQYPEDQLFEETVALDIAFAPKQQKKSPREVEEAVIKAAERLGIMDILDRSPFELSGGQRRRAAIAGVLAAQPDVVILDEPAAGLDPEGCQDLFLDLMTLAQEGATLIIVSHDMEMLTRYADRILVMKEGRLVGQGSPAEITSSASFLETVHLDMPAPRRFLEAMKVDLPLLDTAFFSAREASSALLSAAREVPHD